MYTHGHTHGRSRRWLHQSHRLLISIGIVYGMIIGVQHAVHLSGYQFAALHFGGQQGSYGLVAVDDYQQAADDFLATELTISLGASEYFPEKTVQITREALGFRVATDRLEEDVATYRPVQSFVPGGTLLFRSQVDFASYIMEDEQALESFVSTLHEERDVAPVNAQVHVDRGASEPSISVSADGVTYGKQRLTQAIRNAVLNNVASVYVSASRVEAAVSTDFLQQNSEEITAYHRQTVTFSDGETSYDLPIHNGLYTAVARTQNDKLTYDIAVLSDYVQRWVAPSFEQPRQGAVATQTMNYEAAAVALRAFLLGEGPAAISVEYVSEDTSDEALVAATQTVAAQIAEQYDAAVYLSHFGDTGDTISFNAHDKRPAASTYKLLVAYAVAEAVTSGSMSWDDPILGRSTRSCMLSMIVYSTNHCSQSWVYDVFGATYMNDLAIELGMRNTCFACGEYSMSSTADQVHIMQAIYEGGGLSEEAHQYLLELLERQKWRSGIPYGRNEMILNKIGWLPDYYNDTAIIFTEGGPVGLSIFTKLNGWAQIREITGAVL